MDPLTHGLASFALQRAFFPRARWLVVLCIIFTGIIADLDWFAAAFGASAYLHWHRSATHSLIFLVAVFAAALAFSRVLTKKDSTGWLGFSAISIVAAAALHLAMDSLQADSVRLLWPISPKRFSLDISPSLDPWLITLLLAAILFPELVRLITDEIGARSKRPRGRNGAIIGFVFVAIYFGVRLLFHANVTATLDARTVGGETPHRVAAFPDSVSPFIWHGIVETESAIHLADLRTFGGDVTYATGITSLHKPDPSAALSAAQGSAAALEFLKYARFPKAIVQKESEGFSVEIQEMKDQATGEKSRAVVADIVVNRDAKVAWSELQWRKN